jgi:hypothetical protein
MRALMGILLAVALNVVFWFFAELILFVTFIMKPYTEAGILITTIFVRAVFIFIATGMAMITYNEFIKPGRKK